MVRFNNLSTEESWRIYPLIAKNANTLLNSSALLYKKDYVGPALSLLILGAEEYVKAVILLLHSHNINVFHVKEITEIFHKHKRKHEVAIFLELSNFVDLAMEFDKWNENRKTRRKFSFLDRFIENFKSFDKVLYPMAKMGANITWWNNADDYKKRGFYADYTDELILPESILGKEYINASTVVKDLKKRYQFLHIIFERSPESEGQSIVKMLNDGIALFNSYESKNIKRK